MSLSESNFNSQTLSSSVSVSLSESKWQLNQEAFDRLLNQLSNDREIAGEKYLLLRKNLVRFFENRNIFSVEESADEVLNRLAKKIETGEIIENINSYACGIARLVALEYYKKPKFEELPENLEQTKSFSPFANEVEERETKLGCLEKCLANLSSENKEIVLAYYEGDGGKKIENRKKLGEKLGIPQNALCKRVIRLREKLEKCVVKC